MGDLTKNFSASEFVCPCCGKSKMQINTVMRLQRLRTDYGKKFSPVKGGGYRCANYDTNQGTHNMGRATDPGIPREDIFEFIELAYRHDFTGIGVKQKEGRWQVHIDDYEGDAKRPRPWFWTY